MSPGEREAFDNLVRSAALAADRVAMLSWRTDADRTRAIVREALAMLIGNGIVTVTPTSQWREYIVLDPPYDRDPFTARGGDAL